MAMTPVGSSVAAPSSAPAQRSALDIGRELASAADLPDFDQGRTLLAELSKLPLREQAAVYAVTLPAVEHLAFAAKKQPEQLSAFTQFLDSIIALFGSKPDYELALNEAKVSRAAMYRQLASDSVDAIPAPADTREAKGQKGTGLPQPSKAQRLEQCADIIAGLRALHELSAPDLVTIAKRLPEYANVLAHASPLERVMVMRSVRDGVAVVSQSTGAIHERDRAMFRSALTLLDEGIAMLDVRLGTLKLETGAAKSLETLSKAIDVASQLPNPRQRAGAIKSLLGSSKILEALQIAPAEARTACLAKVQEFTEANNTRSLKATLDRVTTKLREETFASLIDASGAMARNATGRTS